MHKTCLRSDFVRVLRLLCAPAVIKSQGEAHQTGFPCGEGDGGGGGCLMFRSSVVGALHSKWSTLLFFYSAFDKLNTRECLSYRSTHMVLLSVLVALSLVNHCPVSPAQFHLNWLNLCVDFEAPSQYFHWNLEHWNLQ